MIRFVAVALFAGLALGWTGTSAAQEAAGKNLHETFLEKLAPTTVTVKFVMKIHFRRGVQEGDQELEREVLGLVVNDQGLVVISNADLVPHANIRGVQITGTPSDFKVLFPDDDDEEEYEAVLAAKDSNLGLAFVAMKDPSAHELHPVDFAAGTRARIGQELYGVGRLSREFDFAPVASSFRVLARIVKPRRMHLTAGTFSRPIMALHEAGGSPVGLLAVQEGAAGRERMVMLLPADVVNASVMQAAERAKEVLAGTASEPDEPEPARPPEDEGGEGEGGGD